MKMSIFITLYVLIICPLSAQPGDYVVDALVTPKIQETILTIGGQDADICGFSNKSIQTAIDVLPAQGGTIKLSPGTFEFMAPVRVSSNVKLIGSGPETVLRIVDALITKFIVDADYGEL